MSSPLPERHRWSDDRLDDKFETIGSELRGVRPLPMEVAKAHVRIDGLVNELTGLRTTFTQSERRLSDAISEIEHRLVERIDDEAEAQAAFRREYREDREAARQGHGTMISAYIVAGAAIIAALISVAVVILQSHP